MSMAYILRVAKIWKPPLNISELLLKLQFSHRIVIRGRTADKGSWIVDKDHDSKLLGATRGPSRILLTRASFQFRVHLPAPAWPTASLRRLRATVGQQSPRQLHPSFPLRPGLFCTVGFP